MSQAGDRVKSDIQSEYSIGSTGVFLISAVTVTTNCRTTNRAVRSVPHDHASRGGGRRGSPEVSRCEMFPYR